MMSARLHADVEPKVPVGPENARTYNEIWASVDCWALVTIRHAIRDLQKLGRAQKITEGRRARFYRSAT